MTKLKLYTLMTIEEIKTPRKNSEVFIIRKSLRHLNLQKPIDPWF